MSASLTRRDFLAGMACAGLAVPVWARLTLGGKSPGDSALRVKPFELERVRLLPGPVLSAVETNRAYMLGLEPDRLLHTFRVTAGLPSSAQPYGGWEAPINELRGHFTGHYLSACALMFAQTGDETVKHRGTRMIVELGRCQQALGEGYLSAFPRELFERLRNGKRVWAPFYTYHKIMAGLLDSYLLMHNQQALTMVKGMADWAGSWAQPLSDAELQKALNVEHGGMTEVLYNLAAASGVSKYFELGHRFDHERILGPLAARRDELTKVHGNTNVPKVIGAARRFELHGEPRSRDLARYFWEEVALKRSYATGGSTSGEEWLGEPSHLADTLGEYTQETCVTYNMLKLTRHLFTWSADAAYADFYERAFFNGIMGTQHPADGEKAYYTPLASGFWKLFGTPGSGFWCCHGSGVENFAKAGDSIYFHDESGIYVNLFVASQAHWPEKGIRLIQETQFPESDAISFTIRNNSKPIRMSLRVRIPYWANGANTARLNGKSLKLTSGAGSYLVIDRLWRDGDRVEVRLPMSLHAALMPDDPSIQALMFGPLVLAGRLGTDGITNDNRRAIPTPPREVPEYKDAKPPKAPELLSSAADLSSWIKRVPGRALEFSTTGQVKDLTLVPLYRLFDERYAVYWKIKGVSA